jgi:U5 small nuclear ribonucleoprotein component
MDGDLYDEFGNYIGPDLESDEEEENVYGSIPQSRYADEDEEEEDEDNAERSERHGMQIQTLDEDEEEDAPSNAVVLHEVDELILLVQQYSLIILTFYPT